MMIAKSNSAKAFTLMEIILVLAIIAVLIGLGTATLIGVRGDGDYTKAQADVHTLKMNVIRYKTMAGIFPTTSQGLKALVSRPADGPQPKRYKALMKEAGLTDPWGREYQYRFPGKRSTDGYDVFSFGEDGKEGTEDDVGNW